MSKEEIIRNSISQILGVLGDDPLREGLRDTPQRVARMYAEIFSGIGVDPAVAFSTAFEEEEDGGVVILRDVSFFSMCEHHLLPFFGSVQIGYVPHGKICGASKLIRAVELVSRRPQLQERMTCELADAVNRGLNPDGVAVIIEAEHLCMTMRGVRNLGSKILTSAVRGLFPGTGFNASDLLSMLQRR